MLHALRRWLTAQATHATLVAAPRLSARAVERIEEALARGTPYAPIIARTVADNMRALGVFSPAAHRAHFAQLAAHFAGVLHGLRCAHGGVSQELADIAAERIELDDSVEALRTSLAHGPGAVIMGPHIANFLLNLPRLSQAIPLTVYMRYSKDPRRRAAKLRWCQANGMDWIAEPPPVGRPPKRLTAMLAALNRGRAIFITPDMPRKRGDGTPVTFFQREIYLPAGAAVLAVRSGAPLFTLVAQMHGARQRLVVHGPAVAEPPPNERSVQRAAVQRHLDWFAALFERFVREQVPLWYSWGDKRWTRVLRNDPRYVRPLEQAASPSDAVASTGVAGAI